MVLHEILDRMCLGKVIPTPVTTKKTDESNLMFKQFYKKVIYF